MIKRIFRILCMLFRARLQWRRPADCDIVVYDATGLDILAPLLQPWKIEVLHIRGEEVNLPIYLAALFEGKKHRVAYAARFIRAVHPKLVITLMDNNLDFYTVSAACPGAKTMFVQNGYRGYYVDAFERLNDRRNEEPLRVDYLMTFGKRVGTEYAKYINGKSITMGSLKNNMMPKNRVSDPQTIAYISQHRPDMTFKIKGRSLSINQFIRDSDKYILPFLRDYATRNGKRLVIILGRSKHAKDTMLRKAYYDDILQTAGDYSDWQDMTSSYQAVDSASVVVAVDSTLGYESAARGNRTAFFCIRGHFLDLEDRRFGWPATTPDEGPFWVNLPDRDAFERVLDHLFSIDDSEWQTELQKHSFSDHMAYDPGNSILQSTIATIMSEDEIPPTPVPVTEGCL